MRELAAIITAIALLAGLALLYTLIEGASILIGLALLVIVPLYALAVTQRR